MYTNNGKGNAELANLPRKLNIALSPSRDDFPHTHINDVGLVAVKHPDTGEVFSGPSCMQPPSWTVLDTMAFERLVTRAWQLHQVVWRPSEDMHHSPKMSGLLRLLLYSGGTVIIVAGYSWDAATPPASKCASRWDAHAVQVGFNVELGGYFSIKRNAVSMDGDTFLTQAQVVPYCQALLEVYRCRPHILSSAERVSYWFCVASSTQHVITCKTPCFRSLGCFGFPSVRRSVGLHYARCALARGQRGKLPECGMSAAVVTGS